MEIAHFNQTNGWITKVFRSLQAIPARYKPFEIANQVEYYSDHKSAPRERHRMIQSDIKKAEGIIRNVERGIFPGKY